MIRLLTPIALLFLVFLTPATAWAQKRLKLKQADQLSGTRINGEPLTPGVPAAVWAGAHVAFGDALYVFLDPPTLRKLAKLAV